MIPTLFTIFRTVVQWLRSVPHPEFSDRSRISHSSVPDLSLRRGFLTTIPEFFKFQDLLPISHIFHFILSYVSSLLLSALIVDIFFLSFFNVLLYILTPQFYNLLLIIALFLLVLFTHFSARNLIVRYKDYISNCILKSFSYRLCSFEHAYKSYFVVSFCLITGILHRAGA